MKHKTSAIFILIIGLIFVAQIMLFAEVAENAAGNEIASAFEPDVFTEPFTEPN